MSISFDALLLAYRRRVSLGKRFVIHMESTSEQTTPLASPATSLRSHHVRQVLFAFSHPSVVSIVIARLLLAPLATPESAEEATSLSLRPQDSTRPPAAEPLWVPFTSEYHIIACAARRDTSGLDRLRPVPNKCRHRGRALFHIQPSISDIYFPAPTRHARATPEIGRTHRHHVAHRLRGRHGQLAAATPTRERRHPRRARHDTL